MNFYNCCRPIVVKTQETIPFTTEYIFLCKESLQFYLTYKARLTFVKILNLPNYEDCIKISTVHSSDTISFNYFEQCNKGSESSRNL